MPVTFGQPTGKQVEFRPQRLRHKFAPRHPLTLLGTIPHVRRTGIAGRRIAHIWRLIMRTVTVGLALALLLATAGCSNLNSTEQHMLKIGRASCRERVCQYG